MNAMEANTPEYFDASEVELLSKYLDRGVGDMFVYELDDKIVACASINYDENNGVLSWAMVHPDWHQKGIGTELVKHRIAVIKEKGFPKAVVRTSQLTYGFYEKMGFQLLFTTKDYWAKGYDLYQMEMEL